MYRKTSNNDYCYCKCNLCMVTENDNGQNICPHNSKYDGNNASFKTWRSRKTGTSAGERNNIIHQLEEKEREMYKTFRSIFQRAEDTANYVPLGHDLYNAELIAQDNLKTSKYRHNKMVKKCITDEEVLEDFGFFYQVYQRREVDLSAPHKKHMIKNILASVSRLNYMSKQLKLIDLQNLHNVTTTRRVEINNKKEKEFQIMRQNITKKRMSNDIIQTIVEYIRKTHISERDQKQIREMFTLPKNTRRFKTEVNYDKRMTDGILENLSKQQGYCYLRLFMGFDVKPYDLKTELGKEPNISIVFARLLMLTQKNILIPQIYVSGCDMLHVSGTGGSVYLSEAIADFGFSGMKIGTSVQQRLIRNAINTSDMLRQDIRRATNEAYLAEKIKTDAEAVLNAYEQEEREIAEADSFDRLYYSDPKTDIDTLRATYPKYVFVHTKTDRIPPHEFHKLHRQILQRNFYKQAQLNGSIPFRPCGKLYDHILKDVGADTTLACVKDYRSKVHLLCPNLDPRDGSRITTRQMKFEQLHMQGKIGSNWKNYLPGGTSGYVCMNVGENCRKTARFVYFGFVHDMNVVALRRTLQNSDCIVACMDIHFDVRMLTGDGEDKNMNYSWKIVRDRIQFRFTGESTNGYEHDWQSIKDLATLGMIITDEGVTYTIERTYKLGVLSLTFVRSMGLNPACVGRYVSNIFSLALPQDYTAVVYFDFKTKKRFARRVAYVKKDFVESVLNYCWRLDKKFDIFHVLSFAVSASKKVVFNGVEIKTVDMAMDPILMAKIVGALYCQTYKLRFELTQTIEEFIELEKKYRDINGNSWCTMIKNVFSGIAQKIVQPFTGTQAHSFFMTLISFIKNFYEALITAQEHYMRDSGAYYIGEVTFEEMHLLMNQEKIRVDDEFAFEIEKFVANPYESKEYSEYLLRTIKNIGEAKAIGSSFDVKPCEPTDNDSMIFESDLKRLVEEVRIQMGLGKGESANETQRKVISQIKAALSNFKKCNPETSRLIVPGKIPIKGDGYCVVNATLVSTGFARCSNGVADTTLSLDDIRYITYGASKFLPIPSDAAATIRIPDFQSLAHLTIDSEVAYSEVELFARFCLMTKHSAYVVTENTPGGNLQCLLGTYKRNAFIYHSGMHVDGTKHNYSEETVKNFYESLTDMVLAKSFQNFIRARETYSNTLFDQLECAGGLILTRGAAKCMELLGHLSEGKNYKNIVDGGAAPFGATTVLLNTFPRARVTAITCKTPGVSQEKTKVMTEAGNRCFVLDTDINFVKIPNTRKADLFFCDVADGDSWLTLEPTLTVISRLGEYLNIGGDMIIKHPNCLKGGVNELPFTKVKIVKPQTSRVFSTEVYIVCENYDPLINTRVDFSEYQISYVNKVANVCRHFFFDELSIRDSNSDRNTFYKYSTEDQKFDLNKYFKRQRSGGNDKKKINDVQQLREFVLNNNGITLDHVIPEVEPELLSIIKNLSLEELYEFLDIDTIIPCKEHDSSRSEDQELTKVTKVSCSKLPVDMGSIPTEPTSDLNFFSDDNIDGSGVTNETRFTEEKSNTSLVINSLFIDRNNSENSDLYRKTEEVIKNMKRPIYTSSFKKKSAFSTAFGVDFDERRSSCSSGVSSSSSVEAARASLVSLMASNPPPNPRDDSMLTKLKRALSFGGARKVVCTDVTGKRSDLYFRDVEPPTFTIYHEPLHKLPVVRYESSDSGVSVSSDQDFHYRTEPVVNKGCHPESSVRDNCKKESETNTEKQKEDEILKKCLVLDEEQQRGKDKEKIEDVFCNKKLRPDIGSPMTDFVNFDSEYIKKNIALRNASLIAPSFRDIRFVEIKSLMNASSIILLNDCKRGKKLKSMIESTNGGSCVLSDEKITSIGVKIREAKFLNKDKKVLIVYGQELKYLETLKMITSILRTVDTERGYLYSLTLVAPSNSYIQKNGDDMVGCLLQLTTNLVIVGEMLTSNDQEQQLLATLKSDYDTRLIIVQEQLKIGASETGFCMRNNSKKFIIDESPSTDFRRNARLALLEAEKIYSGTMDHFIGLANKRLAEDKLGLPMHQSAYFYDNVKKKFLKKTRNDTPPELNEYTVGFTVGKAHQYVPELKMFYPRDELIKLEEIDINGNKSTATKFYDVKKIASKVLVLNDTKLLLEIEIAPRLRELIGKPIPEHIDWIDGVPGAGKTTEIVNNARIEKDVILCTTRAGRNEMLDEILKKYVGMNIAEVNAKLRENNTKSKAVTDPQLRSELNGFKTKVMTIMNRVRTVASFLLNFREVEVDKMFIDEALMSHFGTLIAAGIKSKCNRMIMIGDKRQIPYINRMPHMGVAQFYSPMIAATITKVLCRSYRCPLDVVYLFRDFYDNFHTVNKTIRSLYIASLSGSDFDTRQHRDTLYLTFTQSEKFELINMLNQKGLSSCENVYTVNEAQGKTSKIVRLYRIRPTDNVVYRDESQILVSMTRHTKQFTYVTVDLKDDVCDYIKKSMQVTDQELMKHNEDTMRKSTFRAGGIPYVIEIDIRDAVVEANLYNPVSFHPIVHFKEEERDLPEPPQKIKIAKHGGLSDMQNLEDTLFPGASLYSKKYNQQMVETAEFFAGIENAQVVMQKFYQSKQSKYDNMEPVLRTHMEKDRYASGREVVSGFIKRNGSAPKSTNGLVKDVIGKKLFDNFMSSAVDDEKRHLFLEFSNNPIDLNLTEMQQWIDGQDTPSTTEKLVMSETAFHEKDFGTFSYMTKSVPKPILQNSKIDTHTSVQTIAFQSKDLNMIWSPIFNLFMERVKLTLKKKFMIFEGASPKELERDLNSRITADVLRSCRVLEMDFSKFDKSQNESHLEAECLLLTAFGVDQRLVLLWRTCHQISKLENKTFGFSAMTKYQRKSGDASTFNGNCLVTLMAIISVINEKDIVFAAVAGDDSFVAGSHMVAKDRSLMFNDYHNFEAKSYYKFQYTYFCSKFIIPVDGWIHVVPDFVKLMIKIGRYDIRNQDHMEEYRISLRDNSEKFKDAAIFENLTRAVSERYGSTLDVTSAVLAFRNLIKSKEAFSHTFYNEDWHYICYDPSLPDLDK